MKNSKNSMAKVVDPTNTTSNRALQSLVTLPDGALRATFTPHASHLLNVAGMITGMTAAVWLNEIIESNIGATLEFSNTANREALFPKSAEQSAPAPVVPDVATWAPQGNAIVESASLDPDGRIVIACTPRASHLLRAGAWLHANGDVLNHIAGMMEASLECDMINAADHVRRMVLRAVNQAAHRSLTTS